MPIDLNIAEAAVEIFSPRVSLVTALHLFQFHKVDSSSPFVVGLLGYCSSLTAPSLGLTDLADLLSILALLSTALESLSVYPDLQFTFAPMTGQGLMVLLGASGVPVVRLTLSSASDNALCQALELPALRKLKKWTIGTPRGDIEESRWVARCLERGVKLVNDVGDQVYLRESVFVDVSASPG